MGRELKRVPMDFDHPIGVLWPGYIQPLPAACPSCHGNGRSPFGQRLHNEWYGFVKQEEEYPDHIDFLADALRQHVGELGTFDPVAYGSKPYTRDTPGLREMIYEKLKHIIRCQVWMDQEMGLLHEGKDTAEMLVKFLAQSISQQDIDNELDRMIAIWNRSWSHHLVEADVQALVEHGRLMDFTHRPRTPEQAAALEQEGGYWMKEPNGYVPTPEEVNLWSLQGMGHDALNQHICAEARGIREGKDPVCEHCKGKGLAFENKAEEWDYENWTSVDPPEGDGYQLWCTTTEGHPMSPVFDSLEKLCAWCSEYATTFGDMGASEKEWMEMLAGGALAELRLPNGARCIFM